MNVFFTNVDFNIPQDKQDPNFITNTARVDVTLPAPSSTP